MPVKIDLTGKIAIVTGGGRGIGRAIALTLASAGADVAVVARSSRQIEAVAEEIRAKGRKSLAIPADVTDARQVESMVDSTISELGGLHILVNNAGINSPAPLVEYEEAQWDQVLDTNLKSVFLCTRTAGKYLLNQKYGRVINIASTGGIVAGPNNASYHASKAGVILFTRSVAIEWATSNITVNAIAPGYITTDMLDELVSNEAFKEKLRRAIPMKQYGTPEDVANIALFLASNLASYVTGETMVVDGGLISI